MRMVMVRLLCLAATVCLISIPVAGQDDGGDKALDESKMYYELGFSYLLQDDKVRAQRLLRRSAAAKGCCGDLARLQLIRLMATEKRKKGESRLPQVRAMLAQIQNADLKGTAWYAAIQSLHDYGETDAALELALEVPRRFAAKNERELKLAASAAFFAAEILVERRKYAAALEQLFYILDADKAGRGEYTDDAYYLLARIYLSRGNYYSPRKAYQALLPFKLRGKQPVFRYSLWRSTALRMLSELER